MSKNKKYAVHLYDIKANLVRELREGGPRAGELITLIVDGKRLLEGLYFVRIVTGSGSKTVKLLFKK